MPTAAILDLAEVLDGAGFAYLEVSGGGVFHSAVRGGVESPWERIRALKARTTTPLGLALRGRFLVGSRPVGGDFARRFVASAAESGIDVFRLHDPLNDVENLREAGEAITGADKEFDAGLIYSPGPTGETETLVEQARKLPDLGAARVLLHDPSGSLAPHRAHELVTAIAEASGPPGRHLLPGLGRQRARRGARGGPRRRRPDRVRRLPGRADPAPRLGRGARAGPEGLGLDGGVDVDALWRAADLVDEHIGDEPVTPLAPRIAVRAAQHNLPAGLVASLDAQLRAHAAGDRIDEVLDELARIRAEAGWPPLAAPIGQILGSQALVHVLSATRYGLVVDELRALVDGAFGTPPGADRPGRAARGQAALAATPRSRRRRPTSTSCATKPRGSPPARRSCCCSRSSARSPSRCCARFATARGGDDALVGGGVDQTRAERIRELVRIVQESGVGELSIEEAGMRVSVRRSEDRAPDAPRVAPTRSPRPPSPSRRRSRRPPTASSASRRRWSAPSTARRSRARRRSCRRATRSRRGQTLCILEAMKLMNEVKADLEATVRSINVENGEPVEYGQLLFELEPVLGRPLDAL